MFWMLNVVSKSKDIFRKLYLTKLSSHIKVVGGPYVVRGPNVAQAY